MPPSGMAHFEKTNPLRFMCRQLHRFVLALLASASCMPAGLVAQPEIPDSAHFYFPDRIQDIHIFFPQGMDWRYVLDSLRVNGDEMALATVRINGQTFEEVGVRYHRSRSFRPGQARNSFDLQLDYIREGQHYQGFRRLYLSDALRDPSMVREVLGYEMARKYMPAPLANYARLTIDTAYYGLMVNVEPPTSARFLSKYFGQADNPLFAVREERDEPTPEGCLREAWGSLVYEAPTQCYSHHFEALHGKEWDALKRLSATLAEHPERVEEVLDVDRALWMHAFNNVVLNLYSYSGHPARNYFLYQDSSGRFVPLLGDMNYAFGSYKNVGTGSDLSQDELLTLDPFLHHDNPVRPMIHALLSQPYGRNRYVHHLQQILKDWFEDNQWVERARQLRRLIREDYRRDPNRFYSMEAFDNAMNKTIGRRSRIPGLVRLMVPRSSFLRKHEALRVVPPQFGAIRYQRRKPFSPERVHAFRIAVEVTKRPDKVWIHYRFGAGEAWQSALMADDGKHYDGQAADGVFGVEILPPPGKETLEFYLEARNVASVNFSPASYMWHGHRITLAELNK